MSKGSSVYSCDYTSSSFLCSLLLSRQIRSRFQCLFFLSLLLFMCPCGAALILDAVFTRACMCIYQGHQGTAAFTENLLGKSTSLNCGHALSINQAPVHKVLLVDLIRKDPPKMSNHEEKRKQCRRLYFCCVVCTSAVCCVSTQKKHEDFIKNHVFFVVDFLMTICGRDNKTKANTSNSLQFRAFNFTIGKVDFQISLQLHCLQFFAYVPR